MHTQGTAHAAVAPAAHRTGPVKGPSSRLRLARELTPPSSGFRLARGLTFASLEAPSQARLLRHVGTGI
jgi:hypothetical protein